MLAWITLGTARADSSSEEFGSCDVCLEQIRASLRDSRSASCQAGDFQNPGGARALFCDDGLAHPNPFAIQNHSEQIASSTCKAYLLALSRAQAAGALGASPHPSPQGQNALRAGASVISLTGDACWKDEFGAALDSNLDAISMAAFAADPAVSAAYCAEVKPRLREDWKPDTTQGAACTEQMSCADKIKLVDVMGDLKKLQDAGQLNEESFRSTVKAGLAGLPPLSQQRIMTAILADRMAASMPTQDVAVLKYMREGNATVAAEMAAVLEASREFSASMREKRERYDSSTLAKWGSFLHSGSDAVLEQMGLDGVLDSDIDEVQADADAYVRAVNALKAKVAAFTRSHPELPAEQRAAIEAEFKRQIDLESGRLKQEITKTQASLGAAQYEMTAPMVGVAAVGFGVAAAGMVSPALLAAMGGGTGAMTALTTGSATGLSAVVGSGVALAVEGGATAAGISVLKRVVQLARPGTEQNRSLYCRALEQEMKDGGMAFVTNTVMEAGMSVAFGGAFKVAEKAGKIGKGIGIALGAGAVGAGAVGIGSDAASKLAQLDAVAAALGDKPELQACVLEAKKAVKTDAAFDAAAFLVQLVGPAALDTLRKRPVAALEAPPPSRGDPGSGSARVIAEAEEEIYRVVPYGRIVYTGSPYSPVRTTPGRAGGTWTEMGTRVGYSPYKDAIHYLPGNEGQATFSVLGAEPLADYLGKASEVFGIRRLANGNMGFANHVELNGAARDMNRKLGPEEQLLVRFFDPETESGFLDQRTGLERFARNLEWPLASTGNFAMHDITTHGAVNLLPNEVMLHFQKQADSVLKVAAELERQGKGDAARKLIDASMDYLDNMMGIANLHGVGKHPEPEFGGGLESIVSIYFKGGGDSMGASAIRQAAKTIQGEFPPGLSGYTNETLSMAIDARRDRIARLQSGP